MNYTVEYYEKSDGTFPAEEFILSQNNKMQAKLFMILELLEEKGPELREPYSKSLGDGIFEIRAKQGSDLSRIMYFLRRGAKGRWQHKLPAPRAARGVVQASSYSIHREKDYSYKRICQENSKNAITGD